MNLALQNDLKSQDVRVSDAIEKINPMDVFKTWKNNDTIKIECASVGCQYFEETLVVIKTEDAYKANIFNVDKLLIAEKELNQAQLEVLKEELKVVFLKNMEIGHFATYFVTVSINKDIIWKYNERTERIHSFKEIKKTLFGVEEVKLRKHKKRKY